MRLNETINNVLGYAGLRLVRCPPRGDLRRPALAGSHVQKLNVGSGKWRREGWHNLDFSSTWYRYDRRVIDINHDLSAGAGLPLPDGSLKIAYSSHTVEHLEDPAVRALFSELRRVMAPGGIFRVTCPDASLLVGALRRRDTDFFAKLDVPVAIAADPARAFVDRIASDLSARSVWPESVTAAVSALASSPADFPAASEQAEAAALDAVTSEVRFSPDRAGNHVNWFTGTKLITMLRAAGFSHASLSAYGASENAEMRDMRYFDQTFPWSSLFVEARA